MNSLSVTFENLRSTTRSSINSEQRLCPPGFTVLWPQDVEDAVSATQPAIHITTLLFQCQTTGRIYMPWFPDRFATYPTRLIRMRQMTLGELLAASLLRETHKLHINKFWGDTNDVIHIPIPKPKLP